MSIIEQINRIKSNISNAYNMCSDKGATLPKNLNSENLSTTIQSIFTSATKKYNLTVDCLFGDVDTEGNLLPPVSQEFIGYGIKQIRDYALSHKFYGDSNIEPLQRGLSAIIFPDLVQIGRESLYYFFTYSSDLEKVSFTKLEDVGIMGLGNAFDTNLNLKTLEFPKLKKIAATGLIYTFMNCQNLEMVTFDTLETLEERALQGAFALTSLKQIYFPSLNKDSFGDSTTQFNNMLYDVSGCVVHFPLAIMDVVSEWNDIITGFGGTNTTVLFDLHIATVNFVTDDSTLEFALNGKKITGTNGNVVPGDFTYHCYSANQNIILIGDEQYIKEDETININIDLTQASNKITLKTGVSGLDVTFDFDGLIYNAIEESDGEYVVNVIANNSNKIVYYVDGGDNYIDANGIIQLSGDDVTVEVQLAAARLVSFVQPVLTSNGVIGGDEFALAEEGGVGGTSYPASNTMNSGTGDYWWASGNEKDEASITFYNPEPLKVSAINLVYTTSSTTYVASTITILGSSDNKKWDTITVSKYVSGATRNIDVNSTKAYKYHKILFKIYSVYIRLKTIQITGSTKEAM